MVDCLADILVKLFQNASPNEILDGKISYHAITVHEMQKIDFAVDGSTSEDSLQKKIVSLYEWVEKELEEERCGIKGENEKPKVWDRVDGQQRKGADVFDMVQCLALKILTFSGGKVVYRYKYVDAWHQISGKLGRNLFVSSFYAFHQYRVEIKDVPHSDMDVRRHDNYNLNRVLDKGIAENHFHLWGSSPYFLLSWISLMNSVTDSGIVQYMRKLDNEPRAPKVQYRKLSGADGFELRHLKAAVIRLYLYSILSGHFIELEEYTASTEWLLEHILEREPVEWLLEGIRGGTEGFGDVTMMEYLECDRELMHQIRQKCPGFYWLFWNCFPGIPMGILQEGKALFGKENMRRLLSYIKARYEPVPLRRCSWLFEDGYQQKYRIEWKYQTQKTVRRLLKDPNELRDARQTIQLVMEGLHDRRLKKHKDYILSEVPYDDRKSWEKEVAMGELWLCYKMMYGRTEGEEIKRGREELYNLFFAYIVIKESFRMELLQWNKKVGFSNFQSYQKRKSWFNNHFSDGEVARITVKQTFSSQNLTSLEMRVVPGKDDREIMKMMEKYDRNIQRAGGCLKDRPLRYYYVIHFHKKKEECRRGDAILRYRHEEFRRDLKKQANAIIKMRDRDSEIRERLKGIDACSNEDGCRPEVFAVAFRVLKSHIAKIWRRKEMLPQLRVSYHVGEDNQDILDGLRAIDEAIYFFNMESGDRLGHATALGLSPEEWYRKCNFQISIRQQDYLDNVAWLYHQMVYAHIQNRDNLLEYLEEEFQKYFSRIYEKGMGDQYTKRLMEDAVDYNSRYISFLDFNIHNYYSAWELRGDHPKLYQNGYYMRTGQGDLWGQQAINRKVKLDLRDNMEAVILYHAYHYNEKIREEGDKPIVKNIPLHMVHGISLVQKEMRFRIAKHGIAIETNPSSNLKIAGLADYAEHPITAFYNKGLTHDSQQLDACPQLNVSINTDDQGVFTTNLYNEYTLMASALENQKLEDGTYKYKRDMVYDWLENVRKMGKEQVFSEELLPGRRAGSYNLKKKRAGYYEFH